MGCRWLVLSALVLGPSLVVTQEPELNEFVASLLNFYVPRSSENPECRAHSELYFNEAIAKTKWAQQMFDSSAKVPGVGLLRGSVYELGQYDECVETAAPELPFEPRYCLLDVRLNLTEQSVVSDLVGNQRLRWAFCVPSSCSNDDVTGHVQAALAAMLDSSGTAEVSVKEKNCRNRVEDYDYLDAGDVVTIVILGLLVLLCVVATVVDYYDTKSGKKAARRGQTSKGQMCLIAFSAYTNGKSIFNIKRMRGSIDCVNGMRWFSIMWVMIGHRYGKELDLPSINSSQVLEGLMYDWSEMIILSAYLAVDTFFVVSGMLLSYLFMKGMDATKKFNLFTFYLYRYIRLTPALGLVIWIYARLLLHTGNGPLWQEVVGEKEVNCKLRWWTNLLYVNNYVYPRSDQSCVPQTWYLAVDMQFFVLSPALLYPLWRWPRAGYVLAFVLLFFGLFSPAYITAVNGYPWTSVWNQTPAMKMDYFINMYCVAWTRFLPYVVGIMLGFLLHKLKGTKVTVRPLLVFLGWTLTAGVGLSIMFTMNLYYKPDYANSPADAASYNSLHHLGWALVVAWIIFACHHGYGGPVNRFLSWRYFQPLAKLQYCAYLTHIMVQLADVGTARSNSYFSHYRTVIKLPGDFMFILLASAAVSLTSELPMLTLEKAFLKAPPKKPPVLPAASDVEKGNTNGTKH